MRRWNEALEYIIKTGANQLDSKRKKRLHIEKGYDQKNASSHFEEDLLTLYRENSSRRILLIFDEIESITFEISPSKHWTDDNDFIYFWQSIRSTYQKNPSLFSFIIAGVNPKCVETGHVRELDNPIYKMIRAEYLNFFGISQVTEMVSSIGQYMGLTFDDELFTYLTDDYGGHPFLIRDVCSYLSKLLDSPQRPARISRFLYKENKQSLDLRLHDYLKLILDVLKTWYPFEYDLLTYLAAGDKKTFEEFAMEWSESIAHLIGYGIVVEGADGYHFKSQSVKDFINKTVKLSKKIAETKGERWKIISERRNPLEEKLRKIVQFVFVPRFGHDDAKDRFLKVIGGKRANKLSSMTLTDILNSTDSEIYLNDLQKTITKYWDYFEHLFGRDRETFEFYLKHINKFK